MKVLLLGGVLALLIATPALAVAQSAATPTRLTLSEPARGGLKGHLTLRVTLTTAAGKPLSERNVAFYELSNVFGPREVLLGTATTDSTGFAAIDYQPSQTGQQTIFARFTGDQDNAASQVSSAIQVREVVPIFTEEPLPLASVRQWLPLGLASLVLATWAVLLGVTIRTVLGVRSAGLRKDLRTSTSALAASEGSSS
jgi:hypothetical protein